MITVCFSKHKYKYINIFCFLVNLKLNLNFRNEILRSLTLQPAASVKLSLLSLHWIALMHVCKCALVRVYVHARVSNCIFWGQVSPPRHPVGILCVPPQFLSTPPQPGRVQTKHIPLGSLFTAFRQTFRQEVGWGMRTSPTAPEINGCTAKWRKERPQMSHNREAHSVAFETFLKVYMTARKARVCVHVR